MQTEEEERNLEETEMCIICYEDYSSEVHKKIVICGHHYCHECIKKLKKNDIVECPLCRHQIFEGDPVHIHSTMTRDSITMPVRNIRPVRSVYPGGNRGGRGNRRNRREEERNQSERDSNIVCSVLFGVMCGIFCYSAVIG